MKKQFIGAWRSIRRRCSYASLAGFVVAGTGVALVLGSAVAQMQASGNLHRPKMRPSASLQAPAVAAAPVLGGALTDLDAANLQAFLVGKQEFEAIETPEGGLGPIFNGRSCVECHSMGGSGGASAVKVTRFGRFANGRFDPLDSLGGSLLQQFAIHPQAQERVPAQANVVALRLATPVFGAGLIEAIPDQDILMNAQRRQPDGIRGQASMVTDVVSGQTRVGRFGWKAQQATLLAFSADAYVNEMGVTSRFFPKENAPNGNAALLARFDKVADVEDGVDPVTGKSDVDHAADFMRFLAPPAPLRLTQSASAGSRVFQQMQCAACHLPVMFTGPNSVAALSNKPVALFSDLLLHDMGSLGDGIEQGTAKPKAMRTAPLWGLRVRGPFLHDGRARTVAEAIRAHDGEGAAARGRFLAATTLERQQLLDYLNSL
jgi:CxxC motif-containing protein (DUF1111 family)